MNVRIGPARIGVSALIERVRITTRHQTLIQRLVDNVAFLIRLLVSLFPGNARPAATPALYDAAKAAAAQSILVAASRVPASRRIVAN